MKKGNSETLILSNKKGLINRKNQMIKSVALCVFKTFSKRNTIAFSFHIGLVSYWIGLACTRHHFHFILEWPPVYMRMHQSNALHAVFACKQSPSQI